MFNITLVCTIHKENGNCNAMELFKIIKDFQPMVIFEELSQNLYSEFYEKRVHNTLETDAIKMYLSNHEVKHIPVVNSDLSKEFDKKFKLLTKHFHFRQLVDKLIFLESKYGFPFLNSDDCEEMIEKMNVFGESVKNDSEKTIQLFKKCDIAFDDYENGILQNIYKYCSENKFENAIMFIGAAHRKSIKKKIKIFQNKENIKLNWKFYTK